MWEMVLDIVMMMNEDSIVEVMRQNDIFHTSFQD